MIGIASARAGAGLALTEASKLPPADGRARDYRCLARIVLARLVGVPPWPLSLCGLPARSSTGQLIGVG